jgi:FG-GAP-like repeat
VNNDEHVPDVAVGDLTGDGLADVVTSGYFQGSAWLEVYRQVRGQGLDLAAVEKPVDDVPQALAVTDLTGDGRDDIAIAHAYKERAGAIGQRTDGTLSSERLARIPHTGFDAHELAVGDLNSDGRPDLAMTDEDPDARGLVVLRQGPPSGRPEIFPPPAPQPAPGNASNLGPTISGPAAGAPAQSSNFSSGPPLAHDESRLTTAGRFEYLVAPGSTCPTASSAQASAAAQDRAFDCLLSYARRRAHILWISRTGSSSCSEAVELRSHSAS